MPTPVRAFLVFPKDKTTLLDRNPEIGRIAHAGFERVRDWLAKETGYTFDLRFDVWRSQRTARELGAYVADSPYGDIPHSDPCGQGLRWGEALAELHKAAGITTGIQSGGSLGRLLAIFINGGGWAGGALTWHPSDAEWLDDYSKSQKLGTDIGYTVLGDWHFTYAATKVTDPCCVKEYGEAFAKSDFTSGLGHEILHALGVECHNPPTYYPNALNADQKAQFVKFNRSFIKPVLPAMPAPGQVPVEPTHPTPAPPPPPAPVPSTPLTEKYQLTGEFTGDIKKI